MDHFITSLPQYSVKNTNQRRHTTKITVISTLKGMLSLFKLINEKW